MDLSIQHAATSLCVCSLFWNVAHSFDFEDFDERHKRMREEFERSRKSFNAVRVVAPIIIGVLFAVFFIIFCCISYHRRQRFWEMQQRQQRHVPSPLAAAPGPGPVTSGAASYPGGSPFMPTGVAPPPPAPYPPQPFMAYSGSGPYANPNPAPSAPFSGAATPWPYAPPPPPPYSSEAKQPL